jgi:6-phosphofructokinase 1
MAAKKSLTIGILTGGGDVPGLNPCIREVVYRGIEEDLKERLGGSSGVQP